MQHLWLYLYQKNTKPSEYVGKLERRLHSGTSKYSSTQAQGKQARDRRAEAVCSRCSSSGGCRQLSRWSLVCVRGRKKKWPADRLAQNRWKVLGASPREAQVESGMVSEQTVTYASEVGKAHCAANAKAACAAISSCATVRQVCCDRAMCRACDSYSKTSKDSSRAMKKFTHDEGLLSKSAWVVTR